MEQVKAKIPPAFAGQEVVFIFDTDCEGMVWSKAGVALQGLSGGQRSWGETRRVEYRLTKKAVPGEVFHLYVEVACNQLWGNGEPEDPNRLYELKIAELVVPNKPAWTLYWDMEILLGLVEGIAISIRPFDETKRKSARSWATQLRHMEDYPDFVFSASQAQQFEWVEENYPELFGRIQRMAKAGRFVPVAGTWVEMDTNMPTGEALCLKFFEDIERSSKELVEWTGELYLEYHRGTYTSQAAVKRYNRQSELLLRDLDALFAILQVKLDNPSAPKPPPSLLEGKPTLDRLWKVATLNQFHDVLPGTSIALVYRDVWASYAELLAAGTRLRDEWFEYLLAPVIFSSPSPPMPAAGAGGSLVVLNTSSWGRSEFLVEVPLAKELPGTCFVQRTSGGTGLVLVPGVPAWSCTTFEVDSLVSQRKSDTVSGKAMLLLRVDEISMESTEDEFVAVSTRQPGYTVENGLIKVTFDDHGRITSYVYKPLQREAIEKGKLGNDLRLFEDIPLTYDAWELEIYHLNKSWEPETLGVLEVEEDGPLRVVLRVTHEVSEHSRIFQRIIVEAGSEAVEFDTRVEWHEEHVVMVSYTVFTDYGRFEVCAHKFADLSEHGFGVSLANDCKYGHSCIGGLLALTLLKAPKNPDENCDMGEHVFRYALRPHAGSFSAAGPAIVAWADHFNAAPILR
ncbi:Alpha-mannosidase 2C1, partial [Cladochytrium tenue]